LLWYVGLISVVVYACTLVTLVVCNTIIFVYKQKTAYEIVM